MGNHFLESCHIETKGFLQQFRPFQYSSQVSETTLNYTNQRIRGEIAPPITEYTEAGVIGEQVASEQATCFNITKVTILPQSTELEHPLMSPKFPS